MKTQPYMRWVIYHYENLRMQNTEIFFFFKNENFNIKKINMGQDLIKGVLWQKNQNLDINYIQYERPSFSEYFLKI